MANRELAEEQAPPHGYLERSGKGFVVPLRKSLVQKQEEPNVLSVFTIP